MVSQKKEEFFLHFEVKTPRSVLTATRPEDSYALGSTILKVFRNK